MKITELNWIIKYRFMTVDPGVITGWAMFDGIAAPTATGLIKAGESVKIDVHRLQSLAEQYRRIIEVYKPDIVVIEDAEFRPGSGTSRKSVASGALALLEKIVGGYVMLSGRCVLLPAYAWKGSLPDTSENPVVSKRIVSATGIQYREHERDAVGIGLAIWQRL